MIIRKSRIPQRSAQSAVSRISGALERIAEPREEAALVEDGREKRPVRGVIERERANTLWSLTRLERWLHVVNPFFIFSSVPYLHPVLPRSIPSTTEWLPHLISCIFLRAAHWFHIFVRSSRGISFFLPYMFAFYFPDDDYLTFLPLVYSVFILFNGVISWWK